jgi:hypothetical protein
MQYKLIQFPKILDSRGNLSFLENETHIPFEIKRVFWTYNVPGGQIRGGHAYKNQNELIIALSGSLDVVITLRTGEIIKINLNRSYNGLYLPSSTWRHMENFSSNSLSLHLSSNEFDESDYIRDFDTYMKY